MAMRVMTIPRTISLVMTTMTVINTFGYGDHDKYIMKIKQIHLTTILQLIKSINSSICKACRHRKSHISNSLQRKVANRQLPVNGLQDLRDAVEKSLLWVNKNKAMISGYMD
jgi:hypothetical protein